MERPSHRPHHPVLLGLFSLVTLLAHQWHRHSPEALTVRAAGWHTKSQATFSNALACVRDQLWKGFSLSGPRPDDEKPPADLLNHFAQLLRYAQ